jgi:hypothetical protein
VPAATQSAAEYRAYARSDEFPATYSGWLHLGFTSIGSLAVLVTAIVMVDAPSALEWLTVPATFLFANFVEYRAHKGPMHHPVKGPLRRLYDRHTLFHHRFFTRDDMVIDSARDFYAVLFPPVMLFFFLGIVATPVAAALFLFATPDAAWLYVATALSYFLSYEWLHWSYHQPPESPIGRLPFIPALRRHHARHHDLEMMSKWNFNITFPICDGIFGTTWREGRGA